MQHPQELFEGRFRAFLANYEEIPSLSIADTYVYSRKIFDKYEYYVDVLGSSDFDILHEKDFSIEMIILGERLSASLAQKAVDNMREIGVEYIANNPSLLHLVKLHPDYKNLSQAQSLAFALSCDDPIFQAAVAKHFEIPQSKYSAISPLARARILEDEFGL